MKLFIKIKKYFKDRKRTKLLRRYFETCCRECPYLKTTLLLERKLCNRYKSFNLPCDPYRCTYIGEKVYCFSKELEDKYKVLETL